MKKPLIRKTLAILGCLFFALALIPRHAIAQCTTWMPINGDFSASSLEMSALAVNSTSVPYVAFKDYSHSDKVSVLKGNGTSWIPVGSYGFSSGSIDAITIKITSGTDVPYVAYIQDNDVYVQKFNGTAWVNVGSSLLGGTGHATAVSLAMAPDNTPYVALTNITDTSTGVQVYKFNGTAWGAVGSTAITPGDSWNASIAINPVTSEPYLFFIDGYVSGMSVMKFDGTSWDFVGSEGFSTGVYPIGSITFNSTGDPYVPHMLYNSTIHSYVVKVSKFAGGVWSDVGGDIIADDQPSVAIDPSDVPYVLYTEGGYKPSVRKFNGSTWDQVGDSKFSESYTHSASLAIDPAGVPYVQYLQYYTPGEAVVKKLATISFSLTGPSTICTGNTVSMTGTPAGGVWTTTNWNVAYLKDTVGTIFNKGATGTATIKYRVGACIDSIVLTNPHYGNHISGERNVKVGATTLLTNPASGGTWTVSTSHASVTTSGLVTGISEGPVTVSYSTAASCGTAIETKLLFAYDTVAHCGTWSVVGAPQFSDSLGAYAAFTVDRTGHPWTVYSDMAYGFKSVVKKFNDTSWVQVGAGTLPSIAETEYKAMAVDSNGIPYVAHQDYTDGWRIHVVRFIGGAWEEVGDIDAHALQVDMKFDDAGNLFVALTDADDDYYRGTVKKWTGSSWVNVGSAGFTESAADDPILAFHGSTIYLGYRAYDYNFATTMMKFNGSAWEYVGTPGFSTERTMSMDMAVNSTGQPYVIYTADGDGNKSKVMTFDGTSWEVLDVLSTLPTYHNSLKIDPSDNVLVSYTEFNPITAHLSRIMGVTVKKFDGSSWSSLGGTGYVSGEFGGAENHLALDHLGNPYLLLQDTFTNRLYVKKFNAGSSSSITGTPSVCVAATTILACATAGGTWTSSDNTVATVGSATGTVTGVSNGTSTISYTIGDCSATAVVTVNSAPSVGTITGTSSVCIGGSSTLGNAVSGGTWSSSNTSVAIVGSATGIVSGVSSGNATITYTVSGACGTSTATKVVTVGTPASITGSLSLCAGMTSTLSGGATGGTWTSSNTAIATIGASSGILTAVSNGTANITYDLGAGCIATATVGVSLPASISGTSNVCAGLTATLTDATPGGNWSSSNTSLATVDVTTGVVTGIAAGTATISYSVSAGCYRTISFTVKANPPAVATAVTVCVGNTASIPPPSSNGLSWTSSNTSVATIGSSSGVLTGIAAGTTTLTYTTITGCFVTTEATVNTVPSITGATTLCAGGTSSLSCAIAGGAWSSSNSTIAAVGTSTGVVTAVASGSATITYNTNGCRATTVVSVTPFAAITGSPSTCLGSSTTLANTTAGGTWSSSNTGISTVGSATGVVTGVAGGNATITYTIGSGCSRTVVVTVVATSGAIIGTLSVCPGSTTTLTGGTSGGTWSGGNATIATINSSTGVVSGIGAGTINVSYTITGCRSTAAFTVNPLPAAITGTVNACVGQTSTLLDAIAGGAWSSNNTSVATVDASTGVVTGVSAATTLMTYTLGTGCYKTVSFTVKALPPAIASPVAACVGTSTSILPPSTNGKSWSSSTTSVATIGSSNGIMTGVSTGTTTLTYTTTTGCFVTTVATVYALPSAGTITGPATVVVGGSITLDDAAGGGVWSSNNTARATVGSATGIVTGVAGGPATISYSVSNPGCTVRATQLISVVTSRQGDNGQFAVSGFQLYPNPTTGTFTVEVEEAGIFSIFSLDGREVTRHNITAGVNQLTLSNELANGIYMCRYTSDSGNTTMVRLVYER